MDIKKYFEQLRKDDYQRDNYDKFLKKIGFKFTLPSVHIAGSNGKGQTAIFIAEIYKSAGYKVGVFTSPYFKNPCESIQINGEPINENDFFNIIKNHEKYFNKFSLSEFEILTFVAFTYFIEQKVDVAIIECGMGGLVDATNIFTPSLSIITSVSMEHTSYLGTSLSEIAMHKAGIIKENVPVLTCELHQDAFNVISLTAKENHSDVYLISLPVNETLVDDGYNFTYRTFKNLKINIKSLTSIKDACFAIEAVTILKELLPIKDNDIYNGLSSAVVGCRMSIINKFNQTLIIDGSHNPEAINSLVKDVNNLSENRSIRIIFSCFKDKNIENMLSSISLLSNDLVLTSFPHVRSRSEEEYFLYLGDYQYIQDYLEAINKALDEVRDGIVLVCGSLAFASLVLDDYKNNKIVFKEKENEITQE